MPTADIQTVRPVQTGRIKPAPAKAAVALRLRNEGRSEDEVCAELGVSRRTLRSYLSKVRRDLGISRPIRVLRGTLAERMEAQTDRNGPMCERLGSQCWTWIGVYKRAYGYIQDTRGEIGERYRRHCSHRVAYMLATGERLKWRSYDSVVLHKCDNPSCVNPEHLEVGTQLENIHDSISRGRFAYRSLSDDLVMEIRRRRAAGEKYAAIAKSIGFEVTTVRFAAIGRTHANLPGACPTRTQRKAAS